MSKQPILAISANAREPLDPQQRKFNRLLGQLDKARAELAAWRAETSNFAVAYDQLARPLLADLRACKLDAAASLDGLLAQPGWAKGERGLLRELVCDVVAGLIEEGALADDEAARLKALHDKHADVDFETENREAMAAMKGLFEAMSGIDLGDEEITSEEDLFQRAHQRMREQAAAGERPAQSETSAPSNGKRRGRPPGAKARREQEEAEATSKTLREVYRKLAAALHPDRASDEADRATRTERMQRANQAYEKNDLLGLLALQLEIEQVDAAHIARITSERAGQLNRLLAEQLDEIRAEQAACHAAFCHGYGFDPYQPLSAKKLGSLLQRELAGLRAGLAQARLDLRHMSGERAAAKRWLKQIKRERDAEEALDGFDFF